ncbi:myb-like protein Q [Anastrepha ludens]|uniref:myb-like protein Q n=1 Tax=Anastrepha ludens TaxID=28586 RepID=UPI0023AEC4A9|nr:myb-like protein Q [Anastrepha ludens]
MDTLLPPQLKRKQARNQLPKLHSAIANDLKLVQQQQEQTFKSSSSPSSLMPSFSYSLPASSYLSAAHFASTYAPQTPSSLNRHQHQHQHQHQHPHHQNQHQKPKQKQKRNLLQRQFKFASIPQQTQPSVQPQLS